MRGEEDKKTKGKKGTISINTASFLSVFISLLVSHVFELGFSVEKPANGGLKSKLWLEGLLGHRQNCTAHRASGRCASEEAHMRSSH